MRVSHFEERISIQFARARRDLIDDLINQFPPPALVVIFAWAFDGRSRRCLLPASGKGPIESRGIERQANPFADKRVVAPTLLGR